MNVLLPVALTDAFKTALEQGLAEVAPSPIPRMGDLHEDIVPIALFLVSPQAAYVTGYSYHADGGLMIDAAR